MSKIRRMTNSCLSVTSDAGTTLFDPGFFTFAEFDLSTIGDVQRVLITHEHDIAAHASRQIHLLDGQIEQDVITERHRCRGVLQPGRC